MSDTKNEYKVLERAISGKNKKSNLNPEKINETLQDKGFKEILETGKVYLIHDPSDIRKPYSKAIENLGKVRDLKSNIINGYSSHNIIGVGRDGRNVKLLSHVSYSTKDEKFLKQEYIEKLENNKSFKEEEVSKKLYDSKDYFNKKTISKNELGKISSAAKSIVPNVEITHVLDREFDDDEYLEFIDQELLDDFVIRSKSSRTSGYITANNKKEKLIDRKFDNSKDTKFQKIRIKKKCIQDGTIRVCWTTYKNYTAVRITILDKNGNNVFDHPMLLLTNERVETYEEAYEIYLTYLKRSKIEYVFKFLKDELGWEKMQIKDFKGIQNLLSLCFYVGSYFFEIGKAKSFDDYAIWLAKIGGCKGKVSRHFILKGMSILIQYQSIRQFIQSNEISQTQLMELESYVDLAF